MKISGLEILVSPVHDQDIADIATGELKKPHRHVIAMWANTTTRQNAERFFEQFGGPKMILRLENPRGMARYLIHMDDPDKAPYSPEDVLEFNGADWKKSHWLKAINPTPCPLSNWWRKSAFTDISIF